MSVSGIYKRPAELAAPAMQFETIDADQLAERWRVPKSWIRNWTREGYANDPIPHVKLGRYVRFEWGSPTLAAWWARRRQ
jgi:hypothetical protein